MCYLLFYWRNPANIMNAVCQLIIISQPFLVLSLVVSLLFSQRSTNHPQSLGYLPPSFFCVQLFRTLSPCLHLYSRFVNLSIWLRAETSRGLFIHGGRKQFFFSWGFKSELYHQRESKVACLFSIFFPRCLESVNDFRVWRCAFFSFYSITAYPCLTSFIMSIFVRPAAPTSFCQGDEK